ncbi:ParA family protein [Candidatus Vondammii sp. HM_W22]|uniref:ParA family protein n=1 Tax=Candidatus Vondammii sp. HM_W22 TaxID=2687299 RepID=UPI001F141996|nr:ParA family protein [Candidatus Vondammii sp. HM_W22]
MHSIVVLNAKGGCGKTTIATTLACYFAGKGYGTALMDYDPQSSSGSWLAMRTPDQPKIRSIDAIRPKVGLTRSWQLYSGSETDVVIMDTPAGVAGGQLSDVFNRADTILIPVMTTIIDLQAAEKFLEELMRMARHRLHGKRIAIIANRVRMRTSVYKAIVGLADKLGIPLIATLRDTQNYSIAMASGMGICEMKPGATSKDMKQWQPIFEWLMKDIPVKTQTEVTQQAEASNWTAGNNRLAAS